eukprot:s1359_g2.t1
MPFRKSDELGSRWVSGQGTFYQQIGPSFAKVWYSPVLGSIIGENDKMASSRDLTEDVPWPPAPLSCHGRRLVRFLSTEDEATDVANRHGSGVSPEPRKSHLAVLLEVMRRVISEAS